MFWVCIAHFQPLDEANGVLNGNVFAEKLDILMVIVCEYLKLYADGGCLLKVSFTGDISFFVKALISRLLSKRFIMWSLNWLSRWLNLDKWLLFWFCSRLVMGETVLTVANYQYIALNWVVLLTWTQSNFRSHDLSFASYLTCVRMVVAHTQQNAGLDCPGGRKISTLRKFLLLSVYSLSSPYYCAAVNCHMFSHVSCLATDFFFFLKERNEIFI